MQAVSQKVAFQHGLAQSQRSKFVSKPRFLVNSALQTKVNPEFTQNKLQIQTSKQICKWLGLNDMQTLPTPIFQSYQVQINSNPCQLTMCTQGVQIKNNQYAAICIDVYFENLNPNEDCPRLMLHWGCSRGRGRSWKPPPPGWKTWPDFSTDAGHGAWQTQFGNAVEMDEQFDNKSQTICLILPRDGILEEGGLAFVISTQNSEWIKDPESQNDFFLDLNLDEQISVQELQQLESNYQEQKEKEKNNEKKQVVQKFQEVHLDERLQTLAGNQSIEQWKLFNSWIVNKKYLKTQDSCGLENVSQNIVEDKLIDSNLDDNLLNEIKSMEPEAERSLMHRYQLGYQLLQNHHNSSSMLAISSWLALSAARHLTWNKNYNVKPRDISRAQDDLTQNLAELFQCDGLQFGALMGMRAIGRGGTGEVGQRIRDEILQIQSRNGAKGGMMEEWHQKLHNNTSPDDIVICKALIAYVQSPDLNISEYWRVLLAENITKERLASFDRPIVSEPKFSKNQCENLKKDLEAYLHTLEAVHGAKDLYAAAVQVLGYEQKQVKGKIVKIEGVKGIEKISLIRENMVKFFLMQEFEMFSNLQKYLKQYEGKFEIQKNPPKIQNDENLEENNSNNVKDSEKSMNQNEKKHTNNQESQVQFKDNELLLCKLQLLINIRQLLRDESGQIYSNEQLQGRLRDIIYFDLALETQFRALIESSLGNQMWNMHEKTNRQNIYQILGMALINCALSIPSCRELLFCVQDLMNIPSGEQQEVQVLRIFSILERTQRILTQFVENFEQQVSPVIQKVARQFKLEESVVNIFSEDQLRAQPVSILAQVLSQILPEIRTILGKSSWSIISSGILKTNEEESGFIKIYSNLFENQFVQFEKPTIMVVKNMGGEEDVPDGCVALIVFGSTVDVLCHAAIRARNRNIPLLSCIDIKQLDDYINLEGKFAKIMFDESNEQINVFQVDENLEENPQQKSVQDEKIVIGKDLKISEPVDCDKNLIGIDQFSQEFVGNKSMGIQKLREILPENVFVPDSVTVPFGMFEKCLNFDENQPIKEKIQQWRKNGENVDDISSIRQIIKEEFIIPEDFQQTVKAGIIQHLNLQNEINTQSIISVWASAFNERVLTYCKRLQIPHEKVRVGVLCQKVIDAKYAFVIHTKNPLNENQSEIYLEIVPGLGETLVGNYPGDAFTFIANKSAHENFEVKSFASKSVALKYPQNNSQNVIIFRSDSNAEDLQGFAGAGLFDSVPTEKYGEFLVNYQQEQIYYDDVFRGNLVKKLCQISLSIEDGFGCAQDIEGVVDQQNIIYIVQSRAQV